MYSVSTWNPKALRVSDLIAIPVSAAVCTTRSDCCAPKFDSVEIASDNCSGVKCGSLRRLRASVWVISVIDFSLFRVVSAGHFAPIHMVYFGRSDQDMFFSILLGESFASQSTHEDEGAWVGFTLLHQVRCCHV